MACPTDQEKGMDIFGASIEKSIKSCEWVGDLVALPSKLDEILSQSKGNLVYKNQCLVFRSMVDLVANHTNQYLDQIITESITSRKYTAAGIELLRVLNGGIEIVQCCADEKFPGVLLAILGSLGQFSEIFYDATRYTQMIDRFLAAFRVQLTIKVEERSDILQIELKKAYEKDKLDLVKCLRANPRALGNLSPNFVCKGLIPMLVSGHFPSEYFIENKELFLEEKLGNGTFGEVCSAKWGSCCDVAVKKLRVDCETFKAEYDVLIKTVDSNCSHIVQMLGRCELTESEGKGEWKEEKLKICLVLELMNADLGFLLKKEMLTLLQSVDIMLQIAKAMKYLHENDVIYRDLKLTNVLFNKTEMEGFLIKLADFGVSKINFQTGLHTAMKGSFLYMAPEMMTADPNKVDAYYSNKVDVFSFGIVCSQILTREFPPTAPAKVPEIQEHQKLLTGKLLEKGIPDRLSNLVRGCLEARADKRPRFAEICDQLWLIKEELLTIKSYRLTSQPSKLMPLVVRYPPLDFSNLCCMLL